MRRTIGRLYRRGACAALAACALFAGFVQGARAAEDAPAAVERFVTFRDGTVLKLTLPDEALAFETLGADEAREAGRRRLSACGDLRFAAQPRLDELAAFRQALRGLASEEFGTREAALQRLKKLAP
ncbi:MAG: hypothetical protein KIS92_26075, partial [Planctomycetota bacterium]|nr:hypothetical protein [Planctomycetota bacterium]